jgi:hypothetical protein
MIMSLKEPLKYFTQLEELQQWLEKNINDYHNNRIKDRNIERAHFHVGTVQIELQVYKP